jgi:hypothetical protein
MGSLLNNEGIGVYVPYAAGSASTTAFTAPSYTYEETTDLVDPVVGCRSASTQKIANNLPQWMELRQKHTSNGQKLINAWACELESSIDYYKETKQEQFLSTSDTYIDVDAAVSELAFDEFRVYEPEFRNMLFNSSFSMKAPSRYSKPSGWSVSRDHINSLQFSPACSLFGDHGILLDGVSGDCILKQERKANSLSTGFVNASVYFKTPSNRLATDEAYSGKSTGIVLTVTYADYAISTFTLGFLKNTEGEWIRASFSAPIDREIHKFEFTIINSSSQKIYIDLPQLELSTTATAWTNGPKDFPAYSSAANRSANGVQVLFRASDETSVEKLEILPVASETEFRDVKVPTRLVAFSPKENPNNRASTIQGRQVNYFGEVMTTAWNVVDGQIKEESFSTHDAFGSVLPRDLILDSTGEKKSDKSAITGSTIVVKASTVTSGWLYVITKETFAGTTGYYLKVCKTDKVNYEDDFIQSYGDLKLEISLGTSFGIGSSPEDIIRLGICKDIPNAIFVDTDLNRRLYFKMKFDYFYADFTSRKIFLRENYTAQNGYLQVL